MRSKLLAITLIGAASVAGNALADGTSRYAQGRVLSATPVVRIVQVSEPREVCREEIVRYREPGATPTIVGALIGGAVGNQFGGGNGRRALTVAGAALGGSIARDHARRQQRPGVRTYCEVVQDYREEEQISGFRVEYEYDGEVYTTRTRRDPGRFIDLRVSVSPVSP